MLSPQSSHDWVFLQASAAAALDRFAYRYLSDASRDPHPSHAPFVLHYIFIYIWHIYETGVVLEITFWKFH